MDNLMLPNSLQYSNLKEEIKLKDTVLILLNKLIVTSNRLEINCGEELAAINLVQELAVVNQEPIVFLEEEVELLLEEQLERKARRSQLQVLLLLAHLASSLQHQRKQAMPQDHKDQKEQLRARAGAVF